MIFMDQRAHQEPVESRAQLFEGRLALTQG